MGSEGGDHLMRLVSVYRVRSAPTLLYELLKTRVPHMNISHQKLPSLKEHKRFVRSIPYRYWYLIEVGRRFVGSVYLTRQNEIGIFLFPEFHGRGYAGNAIRVLMAKHPRERFLANINPANTQSIRLFRRLGFSMLQHTYELRP